jgi:hypothetical protein
MNKGSCHVNDCRVSRNAHGVFHVQIVLIIDNMPHLKLDKNDLEHALARSKKNIHATGSLLAGFIARTLQALNNAIPNRLVNDIIHDMHALALILREPTKIDTM